MYKFQVIKQVQRNGVGKNGKPWIMDVIKGLFTDEEGEVDMFEVVSFVDDLSKLVFFSPGDVCIPLISVRKNTDTQKSELRITSLKLSKNTSLSSAPKN